jgi:hypothetical protein
MKLLGFAYLAVLLGVHSATAQSPFHNNSFGHNTGDIQINYYSDSNCSDYSLQVNVTWEPSFFRGPNRSQPLNWTQLQTGCYTYAYGNSVNIANCEAANCECWFYKNKNCGGKTPNTYGGYVTTWLNNNCLANSSAYLSFMCTYA